MEAVAGVLAEGLGEALGYTYTPTDASFSQVATWSLACTKDAKEAVILVQTAQASGVSKHRLNLQRQF